MKDMNDCATCLYGETCDDACLGYVYDDETDASHDDYGELMGDVERDEKETKEDGGDERETLQA